MRHLEDEICSHDRAGIVTNQPGDYDPHRGLASVAVCGDPSCRARALAWVWATAKEQGVYVSDSSRKPAGL